MRRWRRIGIAFGMALVALLIRPRRAGEQTTNPEADLPRHDSFDFADRATEK